MKGYSRVVALFFLSYFFGIKYILGSFAGYRLYQEVSIKNIHMMSIMLSWLFFGFWTTLFNLSTVGVYELIKNHKQLPKVNLPNNNNNIVSRNYNNFIESKNQVFNNKIFNNKIISSVLDKLIFVSGLSEDKFDTLLQILIEKINILLGRFEYYNKLVSFVQEFSEPMNNNRKFYNMSDNKSDLNELKSTLKQLNDVMFENMIAELDQQEQNENTENTESNNIDKILNDTLEDLSSSEKIKKVQ